MQPFCTLLTLIRSGNAEDINWRNSSHCQQLIFLFILNFDKKLVNLQLVYI